ncbi:unnamed protein product [Phytophthora fragariaefolia]|uniref:Unnamed protein product n=1 Tax=Phytophthora fragariaefolia TaxID=1490495 RepID=A0A9W6Y076_9STRA|nr:unnamed protein product [Phytophthora fragariaefolia]
MCSLDNSEWMRNGDYIPSRLEAQHDAANLLCGTKTQANPESTVGVLAMAGKSGSVADVFDTRAAVFDACAAVFDTCAAVFDRGPARRGIYRFAHRGGREAAHQDRQTAQEEQRTRCSAAVLAGRGSGADWCGTRRLVQIAVDVVSMGELDANAAKLQAFVDAASSNSNSHLVTVPAGVLPSDVLVSSPVLHGDDGAAAAAAASSGGNDAFAEYGGVDPSMDPELALVRTVLPYCWVARRRAAEAEAAAAGAAAPAAAETPAAAAAATEAAPQAEPKQPTQTPATATAAVAAPVATQSPPPAPAPAPASNLPFMDPKFVNSLLSGLPGVDPNDPKIQAAMAQMAKKDEKKDGDEEKKEDK